MQNGAPPEPITTDLGVVPPVLMSSPRPAGPNTDLEYRSNPDITMMDYKSKKCAQVVYIKYVLEYIFVGIYISVYPLEIPVITY